MTHTLAQLRSMTSKQLRAIEKKHDRLCTAFERKGLRILRQKKWQPGMPFPRIVTSLYAKANEHNRLANRAATVRQFG